MSGTPLKVLFDYTPAPGVLDEIGAREGDILQGFHEDQGWWQVSHKGKVGIFPGNYVEVCLLFWPIFGASSTVFALSAPLFGLEYTVFVRLRHIIAPFAGDRRDRVSTL